MSVGATRLPTPGVLGFLGWVSSLNLLLSGPWDLPGEVVLLQSGPYFLPGFSSSQGCL